MADAKTYFGTELPAKLSAHPDKAKEIGGTFLFKITGQDGGEWTVNCKDDVGVSEGVVGSPDCTIEVASDDWETISADPAAAMQLFFAGKLKVSGDMTLATKLQQILN